MRQRIVLLPYIFLFFHFFVAAEEQSFALVMNSEKIAELSRQFLPTSSVVDQIILHADIPIDEYELRSLISFKKGDLIYAQQIQDSVAKLFKKNKFNGIELSQKQTPHGMCITYTLKSDWTLNKCAVSGLLRGKNKYRFLYAIQHGEFFNEEKHAHALTTIKDALNADGYFNHDVSAQLIYNEKNKSVDVRLHIQRGPRFFINSLVVNVHTLVCTQEINALQKEISKNIGQEKGSYFSAALIQRMQQEVEHLLYEVGFLGAQVRVEKKMSTLEQAVTLCVNVDFGADRQLFVQGNSYIAGADIFARIMPPGMNLPCFPAEIIKQDIEAFYKEQGFFNAKVDVQEDEKTMRITIEEGERAIEQQEQQKSCTESSSAKASDFAKLPPSLNDLRRDKTPDKTAGQAEEKTKEISAAPKNQEVLSFGNTIVRGNPHVPFRYIERELCYKKGEPWDGEQIQETATRLRELNIFEHVRVHPDAPWVNEWQKDIFIDVEPASAYELLFRGGIGLQQSNMWCWFGDGTPYTVGGTFTVRNTTGHADMLLLNADVAHGCGAYSASYTIPWLWNSPTKTTVKGYGSHVDQPAFSINGVNIYEAYKGGLLLSLQRHFEFIDCHLNSGCEWLALRTNCQGTSFELCADSIAEAYNIDRCMLGCRIPYFFVEPSLVVTYPYDLVEHGDVQPLTFLTAKAMVPFGDAPSKSYFLRLLAEQSFFVPLGRCLGALRGRLGHIITPCFARVSPLERFYGGGVNSVRSYETDMCPPYGLFYDDTGCCRFVPQGAQSIAMLSAELRVPLIEPLGAVIFQDIGFLKSQEKWRKENNLVLGTGVGLRYITPIGTLSFDIGWKWWAQPDESCYAWFLSLGNAF